MRFGSLFAGIGGIDIGLEAAGMTCAFQVEIDPKCRRVLDYYWPGVPKFGDITQVKGSDLPSVDLLAGGFPCQPVSVAGKRKGQDDARWLWPHFGRLIGELRPRYVLVENVPGLLAQEEAFGEVLTQLAALGYDAEWTCLRAADFGAPHRRERLFLVAHTNRARFDWVGRSGLSSNGDSPQRNDADRRGRPSSNMGQSESIGWRKRRSQPARIEGRSGSTKPSLPVWPPRPDDIDAWREVISIDSSLAPATQQPLRQLADGLSTGLSRTDQLKMLGNAVVPVCAEYVGQLILDHAKIAY